MAPVLTVLAVLFAVLGAIFLVVSFLSEDVTETKKWGIFFIILSAATCLLKAYLANPEPVNNFLRSSLSFK
jgi:membrane-bound ClpP family serine protease